MTPTLATLLLLAAAATGLAKFEPERGCYLGAFVDNEPRVRRDYAAFEAAVGRRHACYVTYSGYGQPFPLDWALRLRAHGAAAHIAWEPNQGLAAVRDDAYLREWARAAASTGMPIFLRFASEMNGNWMPYSGNPALYVEKWRLLHHVLAAEAPNVALIWCVYATPRRSMEAYWPGDEYVDWVGINLYSVVYHNNDPADPARQEDPRELVQYVYDRFGTDKPMMICEFAATSWCRVVGGATVSFALEKMSLLYASLPTRFPRIKGVQWFSWDTAAHGAADNNYSLFADPLVTGRYRALIAGDWFLERITPARRGIVGPPIPPGLAPLGGWPGGGGPSPALLPRQLEFASSPPAPPLGPGDADAQRLASASAVHRAPAGLVGLRPGEVLTGAIPLEVYYPPQWRVRMVTFRANGGSIHATNRAPYRYLWDVRALQPGRYELSVTFLRDGAEPFTSPPLAVEVRRPL